MFGDKADKSRKRIDCSAGGNLKTPAQQPTAKVTSRKENATPAIVMASTQTYCTDAVCVCMT